MEHKFDHYTRQQKARELMKCRLNFFYFLFNYVVISETGGHTYYTPDLLHPKMRRAIVIAMKYGKLQLLMTRQHGKSTLAGAILEWCMNFFPANKAIIINFDKPAAYGNLEKILFIHSHLPTWLATPLKYKGERKTYIPYMNGSILRIFYPSPATPAANIARSMSSAVLFIDEVAHISKIADAYTSAQPVLGKARQDALKNRYPFLLMLATTPNGTAGCGKFAYEMWNNGVDSDLLFEKLPGKKVETLVPKYKQIIADPSTNGIVKVRYHWSEDPNKRQVNEDGQNSWYVEQCREMNFDIRRINQEIDIKFIGGTNCIFTDTFIEKATAAAPIRVVDCPHQTMLKIYEEFKVEDFYMVGIDTASSLSGDFCTIEIYSYLQFKQVGEFCARLGSVSKFAEIAKFVVKYIIDATNGNCLVGVERNSMGVGVVEAFENDTEDQLLTYLYVDDKGKPGIFTSSANRDVMISLFHEQVSNHPEKLRSADLIDQLSSIERNSGNKIKAATGKHDDLFMASCFCAYIKKMDMLDIEPYVTRTKGDIQEEVAQSMGDIISASRTIEDQSDVFDRLKHMDTHGSGIELLDNEDDLSILAIGDIF